MCATANDHSDDHLWQLLAEVPDPEIPVLSIVDLGIVRWIRHDPDQLVVGIAPTYTGCPATEVIASHVVQHLQRNGITATTEAVLSPPWSTDWISESGRKKLHAYGIAPPSLSRRHHDELGIACPRCDSTKTQKTSEFGSTPCKASFKCGECLEPFEYFKCL
ncbi:MAG: phenylacetate-CoA oxygenase subunit PaaJ [Gammaproteobacteria bacterium]|nr:phenylacetate-CoA oxygenase subunit PaaJ [Gammaproteobacteria bacterium]